MIIKEDSGKSEKIRNDQQTENAKLAPISYGISGLLVKIHEFQLPLTTYINRIYDSYSQTQPDNANQQL